MVWNHREKYRSQCYQTGQDIFVDFCIHCAFNVVKSAYSFTGNASPDNLAGRELDGSHKAIRVVLFTFSAPYIQFTI
jgi:hypothetical protein